VKKNKVNGGLTGEYRKVGGGEKEPRKKSLHQEKMTRNQWGKRKGFGKEGQRKKGHKKGGRSKKIKETLNQGAPQEKEKCTKGERNQVLKFKEEPKGENKGFHKKKRADLPGRNPAAEDESRVLEKKKCPKEKGNLKKLKKFPRRGEEALGEGRRGVPNAAAGERKKPILGEPQGRPHHKNEGRCLYKKKKNLITKRKSVADSLRGDSSEGSSLQEEKR